MISGTPTSGHFRKTHRMTDDELNEAIARAANEDISDADANRPEVWKEIAVELIFRRPLDAPTPEDKPLPSLRGRFYQMFAASLSGLLATGRTTTPDDQTVEEIVVVSAQIAERAVFEAEATIPMMEQREMDAKP